MTNKMTKICATILLCLSMVAGYAQETIDASGGDASGSGGTAAYSIGQLMFTTQSGLTGSVSTGVQHAYEIYSVGIEDTQWGFSLQVYPNPTSDNLNLKIQNFNGDKLSYRLFDMQGRVLKQNHIEGSQTQINVADLPSANYYLHISHKDQQVQTFKIIKN